MVKKTRKKTGKIDVEKERGKDKKTIIAVVAIGAFVALLVGLSFGLNPKQTGSTAAPIIDGVQCDEMATYGFRGEAHMDIFIDGKPQTVPSNIGIMNGTCKYWINTGNTGGIINIEAPEQRQFSLSQLIDVWKGTSSLPPPGSPAIFIDGKKAASDLNDTILPQNGEVVLVYGKAPSIIPDSYQFPSGSG